MKEQYRSISPSIFLSPVPLSLSLFRPPPPPSFDSTEENIPEIRARSSEVEVLDEWKVSEVETYGNVTPPIIKLCT